MGRHDRGLQNCLKLLWTRSSSKIEFNTFSTTRGNNYKLKKFTCHYNLRKYSFCSRIVNTWNSIPNDVVEAETINPFKNRLDKHWSNQDVLFNFHADITGIGSLPICMWFYIIHDAGKEDYLRPSELTGLGWMAKFEQKMHYNSKTVQDRCIGSITKSWILSHMCSIKSLCSWWPWVTPNSPSHPNFCIFRRLSYLCSGPT